MSRQRRKGTSSQHSTPHRSASAPGLTASSNLDRIADLGVSEASEGETPFLDAFCEDHQLGQLGASLRLAVAPPDDTAPTEPWADIIRTAPLSERAGLFSDIPFWVDPFWDRATVEPSVVRSAVDPLRELAQRDRLEDMLCDLQILQGCAPEQLRRIRQGQHGLLPTWLSRLGPVDALSLLIELSVDPEMEQSWLALVDAIGTHDREATHRAWVEVVVHDTLLQRYARNVELRQRARAIDVGLARMMVAETHAALGGGVFAQTRDTAIHTEAMAALREIDDARSSNARGLFGRFVNWVVGPGPTIEQIVATYLDRVERRVEALALPDSEDPASLRARAEQALDQLHLDYEGVSLSGVDPAGSSEESEAAADADPLDQARAEARRVASALHASRGEVGALRSAATAIEALVDDDAELASMVDPYELVRIAYEERYGPLSGLLRGVADLGERRLLAARLGLEGRQERLQQAAEGDASARELPADLVETLEGIGLALARAANAEDEEAALTAAGEVRRAMDLAAREHGLTRSDLSALHTILERSFALLGGSLRVALSRFQGANKIFANLEMTSAGVALADADDTRSDAVKTADFNLAQSSELLFERLAHTDTPRQISSAASSVLWDAEALHSALPADDPGKQQTPAQLACAKYQQTYGITLQAHVERYPRAHLLAPDMDALFQGALRITPSEDLDSDQASVARAGLLPAFFQLVGADPAMGGDDGVFATAVDAHVERLHEALERAGQIDIATSGDKGLLKVLGDLGMSGGRAFVYRAYEKRYGISPVFAIQEARARGMMADSTASSSLTMLDESKEDLSTFVIQIRGRAEGSWHELLKAIERATDQDRGAVLGCRETMTLIRDRAPSDEAYDVIRRSLRGELRDDELSGIDFSADGWWKWAGQMGRAVNPLEAFVTGSSDPDHRRQLQEGMYELSNALRHGENSLLDLAPGLTPSHAAARREGVLTGLDLAGWGLGQGVNIGNVMADWVEGSDKADPAELVQIRAEREADQAGFQGEMRASHIERVLGAGATAEGVQDELSARYGALSSLRMTEEGALVDGRAGSGRMYAEASNNALWQVHALRDAVSEMDDRERAHHASDPAFLRRVATLTREHPQAYAEIKGLLFGGADDLEALRIQGSGAGVDTRLLSSDPWPALEALGRQPAERIVEIDLDPQSRAQWEALLDAHSEARKRFEQLITSAKAALRADAALSGTEELSDQAAEDLRSDKIKADTRFFSERVGARFVATMMAGGRSAIVDAVLDVHRECAPLLRNEAEMGIDRSSAMRQIRDICTPVVKTAFDGRLLQLHDAESWLQLATNGSEDLYGRLLRSGALTSNSNDAVSAINAAPSNIVARRWASLLYPTFQGYPSLQAVIDKERPLIQALEQALGELESDQGAMDEGRDEGRRDAIEEGNRALQRIAVHPVDLNERFNSLGFNQRINIGRSPFRDSPAIIDKIQDLDDTQWEMILAAARKKVQDLDREEVLATLGLEPTSNLGAAVWQADQRSSITAAGLQDTADRHLGFDSYVFDAWSSKTQEAALSFAAAAQLRDHTAGRMTEEDLEQFRAVGTTFEHDAKALHQARKSAADTTSWAVAIAIGTVVSALSGGVATPFVAALLTTALTGVADIAIQRALLGEEVDLEEESVKLLKKVALQVFTHQLGTLRKTLGADLSKLTGVDKLLTAELIVAHRVLKKFGGGIPYAGGAAALGSVGDAAKAWMRYPIAPEVWDMGFEEGLRRSLAQADAQLAEMPGEAWSATLSAMAEKGSENLFDAAGDQISDRVDLSSPTAQAAAETLIEGGMSTAAAMSAEGVEQVNDLAGERLTTGVGEVREEHLQAIYDAGRAEAAEQALNAPRSIQVTARARRAVEWAKKNGRSWDPSLDEAFEGFLMNDSGMAGLDEEAFPKAVARFDSWLTELDDDLRGAIEQDTVTRSAFAGDPSAYDAYRAWVLADPDKVSERRKLPPRVYLLESDRSASPTGGEA